jgi:hypothetical protein
MTMPMIPLKSLTISPDGSVKPVISHVACTIAVSGRRPSHGGPCQCTMKSRITARARSGASATTP